MPVADKVIGAVLLFAFSLSILLYMFVNLILIPLLPSDNPIYDQKNAFNILTISQLIGVSFWCCLVLLPCYCLFRPWRSEDDEEDEDEDEDYKNED